MHRNHFTMLCFMLASEKETVKYKKEEWEKIRCTLNKKTKSEVKRKMNKLKRKEYNEYNKLTK